MLKRNLARSIVLPVTLVALGVLMGQTLVRADSVTARMDTFTNPDGVSSFSLSLKPATAATTAPRDIVVLVNTSASQTGEYRAKALDALKGLLAGLNSGDRVRLVAVDLNAIPLTKTFVAPSGKEMEAALAELDARVPLGASDMSKAIEAVVDSYRGDATQARAAVYIGDGRSTAHLLAADEFQKLAGRLADARIPVSSYAIGGRIDRQLLGALATQSGGAVILEGETSSQEAGRSLAAAADATVLWPASVAWPAEMSEVFPKRMPPLRTDRETIVLGTVKGKDPLKIELELAGASGPQKLAMTVSPGPSDERNTYLAQLVQRARLDGGVTMPLAGSADLEAMRAAINSGLHNIDRLARQALANGNLDGAEKLIGEALRQDPNDTEALSLKGILAKSKPKGGVEAKMAADPPPPGPAGPPGPAAPAAPPPPAAAGPGDLNLAGPPPIEEPPPGALAEGFQHEHRIIAQAVEADVRNALNKARSLMTTDPDLALQQLRLTLEKVRQTVDLEPDVRDQFVVSLQAALAETAVQKGVLEQHRQQQLESRAAANERLLAASRMDRAQMTVKELFERFNSLLNERNFVAAEEVAMRAQRELPNTPTATMAPVETDLVGNYANFMQLRIDRQKGVVDTLFAVEKSHIPFPDDQPIVYPDAGWWQEMTMRRKGMWSSMDLAKKGSAEKKIDEALKSPTELQFSETPLNEVIDYLKDRHKIEIQIDDKALSEAGIGTDSPVTIDVKGISLRSALRLMLRKLSLTYLIKDEVLQITTPDEADQQLTTKVYPVADLVLPIPQGGMMGGMGGGMMGGMGGGMGGMSGGMGGMGGGGGGMMGGMGGGMGGGFNVPPERLPKVGPGGFQAFSVKDDLSVPAKPTTTAGTTVPTTIGARPATVGSAPLPVDTRPAKIEIGLEGAKPDVIWDKYFATNNPQPKAVRGEVRSLMSQRKFDHVIALIGAALRHRQGQPWMYEGLALALEAAGRPKADVERAIMSAVDFVDSTTDLMYIGAYLSRMGFDARAMQIYQQAASLDPLRPEPYMLGLEAARNTNDLEGLKWASLGVLGQAWPKEQASIWEKGMGVSREVLERLKAENRTKEADEYLAKLNEAVARDCVAIVTWTGEGEIDALVEEPNGTVCSLRNPRTAGGGIMLDDAIRQTGHESFGGHSAVYCCPKGFDGTYKLWLRRVWGNVTAGKVNVQVLTHDLTPQSVAVQKRIPLDKDQAAVVFTLENGRRKEPLREQQVASVVNTQLAVNRQVLAEQLAGSADLNPQSALSQSGGGSPLPGGNGGVPFFGGGAVGYEPVIIWLPEGAFMGALAVVSADRRYVRITASPFFSGVSQVNTFNTTNGATGSGSSGSNGSTGGGYNPNGGSGGGSGIGSGGFS